jgi:hypothetical protein
VNQNRKQKRKTFLLTYVEKLGKIQKTKKESPICHSSMGTATHTNVHSEAPDQDRPIGNFSTISASY